MDGETYDAGARSARRGLLMVVIGALSVDPDMSGRRLAKILAQDIDERDKLPENYKETLRELEVFDDTD